METSNAGPVSPNPNPQAQAQAQQQQAPRTWVDTLRMVVMQLLIMYAVQTFLGQGQTRAPASSPHSPGTPASALYKNAFQEKDEFSLLVYVTPQEVNPFSETDLVWRVDNLVFGDWESGANKDGCRALNITIPVTEDLANNGSLWSHVYCVKTNTLANTKPSRALEDSFESVSHSHFLLTRFLPKPKATNKKNLLTGSSATEKGSDSEGESNEVEKDMDDDVEYISFWHNDLSVNIVADTSEWPLGAIPPSLRKRMRFNMNTHLYAPVVYVNDFWVLREQLFPINATVKELSLQMTFAPLSLFKWQMMVQYQDQQEQQQEWGTGRVEDQEAFKRMLLETNPYLLGLTFAVSLLHTIFDCLAFKNDIQFWRNRKDMEGLSIRSLFTSIIFQVIILLYLLDQDTNWLVLISSFVGLGIDIWKVRKVARFEISKESKIFGFLPKPTFVEKFKRESKTDEYDELAFRYLSWALFPLLGCYAIYSLIYEEHKGWYSYVVNMLAGAVYTFGFIMMTPQLFINYKLKSVAHLPWRMLTYRALNTFIDDLFAFIIKMPTMHRLACFRDDLIFFIYIYQRWIYRVDMKRANSYGVTGEQIEGNVPIPSDEQSEITGPSPSDNSGSESKKEK